MFEKKRCKKYTAPSSDELSKTAVQTMHLKMTILFYTITYNHNNLKLISKQTNYIREATLTETNHLLKETTQLEIKSKHLFKLGKEPSARAFETILVLLFQEIIPEYKLCKEFY
jgi:hypothetical protein